MMNDWYQRMVDTLQLNGKGERTQQAYTRSVRMLSQFYDKTPDLVSEQELQHSNRSRTLPLEIMEFIRRFLQHVLPTGFMKVRYYGFMNPNCKLPLDHIRNMIERINGFDIDLPKAALQPSRPIICPSCGGRLKLRFLLSPAQVLLWSG